MGKLDPNNCSKNSYPKSNMDKKQNGGKGDKGDKPGYFKGRPLKPGESSLLSPEGYPSYWCQYCPMPASSPMALRDHEWEKHPEIFQKNSGKNDRFKIHFI